MALPDNQRLKFTKQVILYATLIVVFGGVIFYLLHTGKSTNDGIAHHHVDQPDPE